MAEECGCGDDVCVVGDGGGGGAEDSCIYAGGREGRGLWWGSLVPGETLGGGEIWSRVWGGEGRGSLPLVRRMVIYAKGEGGW